MIYIFISSIRSFNLENQSFKSSIQNSQKKLKIKEYEAKISQSNYLIVINSMACQLLIQFKLKPSIQASTQIIKLFVNKIYRNFNKIDSFPTKSKHQENGAFLANFQGRLLKISLAFQQQYIYRLIVMFGDHFYLEPISSSKSLDSTVRAKQSSAFDLQYEICSRYMKIASEQLCQREIELMQNTTKFFEKITDSFSLKDISSTQQSFTLDSILEDEDPFAQPSKSKLLLRKSKSNSSLRRTDTGLSEALREVQKKCSEKTSVLIANMSNEYKRMKQKLAISQKFEKDLKKLEAKFLANEQELVLIKKKASDLEVQNKKQTEESNILKKKLKQMNDESRKMTLHQSKSSDNLLAMASAPGQDKLKKYIEEKQVHIYKKEKEVKNIQDKIQRVIEGVIDANSCDKCCQLVKRIKESILKYRAYLEQESKAGEALYAKYKQLFST